MPFKAEPLTLTSYEREELREISLSRSLPAGDAFKARLILMLAAARSYADIRLRLETTSPTISHWRKRFPGLTETRHPGRQGDSDHPQTASACFGSDPTQA